MLGDEALVNVNDITTVTTETPIFNRGDTFFKATPDSRMEPLTDQVSVI